MRKNRHQGQQRPKHDDTLDLESKNRGNRRSGPIAGNRSQRDTTRSANRGGSRKGISSPGRRSASQDDLDRNP